MQFTISRSTLLKPLQLISSVVEKRQTMPILANVLLRIQNQNLSLTATDSEIELIGKIALEQPPSSTEPVTVSAKKLFDICRALPEEAILQFSVEKDHLNLRSGKSRFTLGTLPAADFPSVEEGSFSTQFSLNQNHLKKLLTQVYFAMGHQDVRHYLNGTLFDIGQGTIKCAATDGHRLAVSFLKDDALVSANNRVILPRKTVLELMRLLDSSAEQNVQVCVGENLFRVITQDFIFTSRLISAQYPDYEKLFPRNIHHTAIASREALKQALARAAILSNEKFRSVRLHLNKDQLKIIANNPEQEEAEELIPLDYQGNEVEIGFNVGYLLDVVSTLSSETIKWSFSDPNIGVVIEPCGNNEDSRYVVMPMRL